LENCIFKPQQPLYMNSLMCIRMWF
jgi:hypothetical protein